MNPIKLFIHENIFTLRSACQDELKSKLCKNQRQDSCYCADCLAINEHTHAAVLYLPQKNAYTKDDIQPLLIYGAQKRNASEPLIFIIENPENILPAAANSLLKTLEEPAENTYFIFLCQNIQNVLPTIISRAEQSFILARIEESISSRHELFDLVFNMCAEKEVSSSTIEIILQKKCPDSTTSIKILNDLIAQITDKNVSGKKGVILNILYSYCSSPASPGGSKIFWRTLILELLESLC
jgi:DNA polymerase III delta prime subunit